MKIKLSKVLSILNEIVTAAPTIVSTVKPIIAAIKHDPGAAAAAPPTSSEAGKAPAA